MADAAAGNPDAQADLGEVRIIGRELPRDEDAALALWQAAAERGSPDGMIRLAKAYRMGWETPVDARSAYMWLTVSERLGPSGDREAIRRARRDAGRGLSQAKRRAVETAARAWAPAVPLPTVE